MMVFMSPVERVSARRDKFEAVSESDNIANGIIDISGETVTIRIRMPLRTGTDRIVVFSADWCKFDSLGCAGYFENPCYLLAGDLLGMAAEHRNGRCSRGADPRTFRSRYASDAFNFIAKKRQSSDDVVITTEFFAVAISAVFELGMADAIWVLLHVPTFRPAAFLCPM